MHTRIAVVPFQKKTTLPAIISAAASAIGASAEQLLARRCVVFRPSKSAMQAGLWQTKQVRLEFDNGQPRWESRNLAWTASRDPLQGVVLKFGSVQKAIEYCQSMGLHYSVEDDADGMAPPIVPKVYADNFAHSTGKLKVIRTK